MGRLKEISEKIENRKKKLRKNLDILINQLKSYGAIKIFLFGSFAQEKIDVNSDLDLFVIMPSNKISITLSKLKATQYKRTSRFCFENY